MVKYNIDYSCGCIHEIEEKNGVHNPTGKQTLCEEHKRAEKDEN